MCVLAAFATVAAAGCEQHGYRARFHPSSAEVPARDGTTSEFLKAHTRRGEVFVFETWTFDEKQVTGRGRRYDVYRNVVADGAFTVALADVAIFETNRPEVVPRSAAGYVILGVVTAASLAVTLFCAVNPKACFGSCPTFYVDGKLEAEGFSASIARPLEATDVDAMWTAARSGGGTIDIEMVNEALETHLVDHVRLLAAPRDGGKRGARVYRAGDRYFAAAPATAPASCRAVAFGTSCLDDVRAVDEAAYLSPADGKDLIEKETLELTFPAPRSRAGIVIAARNSLLNTFVFYQGLAYAGRNAAAWYARLDADENAPLVAEVDRLIHVFGGIDVFVKDGAGAWQRAGAYDEVGPLAREVQLVAVPPEVELGPGPLEVRLTMTRGAFKLDQVGLVALDQEVRPVALEPVAVTRRHEPDEAALQRLRPGGDRLTTYPGDAYGIRFELPPGEWELFLESRGHYYEWIREPWLLEENALYAAEMLDDPRAALRRLAPAYKRVEDRMESIFWQSRVGVRR
jgi:hypothetical protein